jgi:hypothetical protein
MSSTNVGLVFSVHHQNQLRRPMERGRKSSSDGLSHAQGRGRSARGVSWTESYAIVEFNLDSWTMVVACLFPFTAWVAHQDVDHHDMSLAEVTVLSWLSTTETSPLLWRCLSRWRVLRWLASVVHDRLAKTRLLTWNCYLFWLIFFKVLQRSSGTSR